MMPEITLKEYPFDKFIPMLPESAPTEPVAPPVDVPAFNPFDDLWFNRSPINLSDIYIPPANPVDVVLFRMSLNPSDINAKSRDDFKTTADNIKIALKGNSAFEKILDVKLFSYANDYCQYFGAYTDACLAGETLYKGISNKDRADFAKSIFYTGSALAKYAEIQNKNTKKGRLNAGEA